MIPWLEEHPTFSIGGAIVLILLVGAVLLKGKSGVAASTPGGASDLTGLGVNAAGQPVVYVPTSTEFYTDNSETATSAPGAPASISNTNTSTSTSTTTTTNPVSTIPLQPPIPKPKGGTTTGGTHPPRKPPPPPAAGKAIHWTLGHHVGAGETLTSIAEQATGMVRHTGGPSNFRVTWQQIYSHNQQVIDAKARSMGGRAPYYNDIYPGELIVVPEWR